MQPFASLNPNPGSDEKLREFAADVRTGLSRSPQKELYSKYFYDELGTALFDTITRLPEYGLTRADQRLLTAHAADVALVLGPRVAITELGSGTGQKTRSVVRAFLSETSKPAYYPIDVSDAALRQCAEEMQDSARVVPVTGTYLAGLSEVTSLARSDLRLLVLFLGSTIGNFDRRCAREFLRDVRGLLSPGDALLLGADLVKPEADLLLAYDDPTGVTACFNRNLLGRINRELGGNFDLRMFEHEARYNEAERRIEMHLRSTLRQTVTIRDGGYTVEFGAGETIWTESSHKFTVDELHHMAAASGFSVARTWVDEEWPFAETLWVTI